MAKKRPQLFFLSGRLKWLGIAKDWERPADQAAYDTLIKESDFIAESELERFGLANSASVRQDLADLNNVLLVPYFESSQKARHYQNDYLRQQWTLVLGTLLTSVIATVTVSLGSEPSIIRSAGIATALVTFVTTIVTYLVQANRPQYHWYRWRTVTEELRRHYYLFLAHMPPYHTTQSHEVLEKNVAQIMTHQQPEQQTQPQQDTSPAKPHHAEADYDCMIRLYREKRVEGQLSFYTSRLEEFRKNANFVAFTGVALVALATLLSAVNAVFGQQWVVLMISLLPVMAALLVLFEKIYGWGRQVVLYDEAVRRLTVDNTIPPVAGHAPSGTFLDVFLEYVGSVENTLQAEMNQWGQSVLRDGANAPTLSAQETLEMALAKSSLSEEQIADVRKIFAGP